MGNETFYWDGPNIDNCDKLPNVADWKTRLNVELRNTKLKAAISKFNGKENNQIETLLLVSNVASMMQVKKYMKKLN